LWYAAEPEKPSNRDPSRMLEAIFSYLTRSSLTQDSRRF
jgi:hypothetical protein